MFEKHLSATWQVDLSGLLNLDHPKAVEAGLTDRSENIELYVYTLTHPTYGTYIVDSGISESFRDPSTNSDLSFLIKAAMGTDSLQVKKTTHAIQSSIPGGIKGVFLTHVHLDHIMGISDLNEATPVYIGPGDTAMTGFQNLFTQGTTDRLLAKAAKLNEWQFNDEHRYIDVFGDGSLWAIHTPGHTPGSTSYLVRTTEGAELLTGDASHTAWGWQNGVEPGTYSEDQTRSAISLNNLKMLESKFPAMRINPGHQSLQSPASLSSVSLSSVSLSSVSLASD